jgi:hypothetical protein
MKKKLLVVACLSLLGISSCLASSELSNFDKKMIDVQKKMIAQNKNFKVESVKILRKKDIDDKWKMYTFDIALTNLREKKKFNTPMIIFTDGKYETNSLMNIDTGIRYEREEKARLNEASKSEADVEREAFEKSFTLDEKYYDKEHLIVGSIDAKNKVVIVSDPLCVACIRSFPAMYNSIKNKSDFALFYYHFPLKRLHPTAETISIAMKLAKNDGIKDVEVKVYEANFENFYDVYKTKDKQLALDSFNKIFKTSYTISDISNSSVDEDIKIGGVIRLTGTPSVIFNGSIYKSRAKLAEAMKKN